jgi:predicted membrane channel-forming protein YqfA (hemolysin III family)
MVLAVGVLIPIGIGIAASVLGHANLLGGLVFTAAYSVGLWLLGIAGIYVKCLRNHSGRQRRTMTFSSPGVSIVKSDSNTNVAWHAFGRFWTIPGGVVLSMTHARTFY